MAPTSLLPSNEQHTGVVCTLIYTPSVCHKHAHQYSDLIFKSAYRRGGSTLGPGFATPQAQPWSRGVATKGDVVFKARLPLHKRRRARSALYAFPIKSPLCAVREARVVGSLRLDRQQSTQDNSSPSLTICVPACRVLTHLFSVHPFVRGRVCSACFCAGLMQGCPWLEEQGSPCSAAVSRCAVSCCVLYVYNTVISCPFFLLRAPTTFTLFHARPKTRTSVGAGLRPPG